MSVQPIIDELDEFLIERKEIDLKVRLKEIAISASNLPVESEEGFRRMTSLYAESKNWEKQIEFARKQANAPDQDKINARNDKAKELLTPLKEIQRIAKTKCERYQLMLEEQKAKEEAKIQDAVDLLGLDETPYLAPVEKSIRGEGAIVYTRTVRKFRIVDLAKVPAKYFKIDEDLIDQDIKLGVGEIDGIEIYEEKQTSLRTR